MKNVAVLFIIVLLLVPFSWIPSAHTSLISSSSAGAASGDIISLSHDPYPTLSRPSPIIVILRGRAAEPFSETLVITDEFQGLVETSSEMTWVSGSVTELSKIVTIGRLPQYTVQIPWYPTIVGNHTFHIVAGSFPEWEVNASVSFDVDGIITPSLGHPCIVSTEITSELQVVVSETHASGDPSSQILSAQLQSINGSLAFSLENQVASTQYRFPTDHDYIQDESIVTYNISTIPDGFYDIHIRTAKQNYSWPHAVKIQDEEPQDFKVVQLSDVHIGKHSNIVDEKKMLADLITFINEDVRPDFVILTGDSVDWFNEKYKRNAFSELKKILLTCEVPIFTTPGNHERYSNGLFFLYYPFTNLTGYHLFLNPLSDYAFDYGDVNFVFLDSGYDFSRWEIHPQIWNTTPEGSGLTAAQMYLLNTTWGNPYSSQIISMHHPAVYDRNDSGRGAVPNNLPSGNDNCIAFNRGVFIEYCINDDVTLVLTGHTHENHVFNSIGKEPGSLMEWPVFVQTRSGTLSGSENGGRVVHVQNGTINSYEYAPFH